MSVTSKIAAVLLIVFAALVGGAWAILQTSVRPIFDQQEVAAHDLDRARVEANLAAVAEGMRGRVLDYARWDDTYRYFQGVYPGYTHDNFAGSDWLSNYGADLAIYLDDEGRPLWSQQRTADGITQAGLRVSRSIFNQVRGMDGETSLTGAVWTEATGPMIYAAARATRTDGSGAPRGYVILGRRLDTAVLAQQTQLEVAFTPEPHTARSWQTRGHLNSLIPITSARGDVIIGGVITKSERTISALGARTVSIATALMAFVLAGGLGALWFSLRHIVIARIQRMERHLRAQSDAITPMAPDRTIDEISHLTTAYNALARRIAEADERAGAAVRERESTAAANRMKSDFLANISYELRTPLNDVIGYADLIGEDLADRGDTSVAPDLKRITGAARSMLSLLTELLDLSRIEADRLEIAAESFEVEEVFLSAAASARPSALAHSATLNVRAPHNLGQAMTDQNRLRQCLVNTLIHASRRSSGGALSLGAERIGDVLRFEVTDSGRPLTEAQMAGLFEPFLREDDERLSGARLGLAVTRKLAELMEGGFEVTQSETGCTYVLKIPANLNAPRKTVREDAPPTRASGARFAA